jgi:pimeloyl-ACP methyl ester carboxylesterase
MALLHRQRTSVSRFSLLKFSIPGGLKLFVLVVILFSTATFSWAAPEVEPNDSTASANSISFDANQTGAISQARISSLSDVDYFKIVTPSFQGTTTLTATMTPTSTDKSLDASISLRNSSGTILASKDAGGDNVSETLTFSVSGGTTYFLTCSSADIFSLGIGDYTLSVSLVFNDPNDQIAEAIPLGAVNQTISVPQPAIIDPSPDVDMYSFTVAAGQRISFNVDCPSGVLKAAVRLFDTSGLELGANLGGSGPGETPGAEAYLEYTFQLAGTYYLGVSGVGNGSYSATAGTGDIAGSTGSYTLVLSPGLAGTIRRPIIVTDFPVDIVGFGTVPKAIDPNTRTWIVTHGWNSSRTNENIASVARSLAELQPQDQVLTLDWRAAANALLPSDAESSILPVAEWAAAALTQAGFKGTNVNLVGHSFGSYVSDEIAERMGGVNSIITFDPAADIIGGYTPDENDQVNFARDSNFSWSFHSSNLGSDKTPFTADEEFLVTGLDPVTAHGDVLFFFSFLLSNPNDPISQYFFLSFLLNETYGSWIPDQYTSPFLSDDVIYGYEADIVADPVSHEPETINFVAIITESNAIAVPEGGTGLLRIKLSAQPVSDVRVDAVVVSGDTDVSIQSGAPLTFTTANWNQFQMISITAANDIDAINGFAVIRLGVLGHAIKEVVVNEIDSDRLASHPKLSSMRFADGQFRFALEGEAGTVCVLYASIDLKQWLPVSTNTIPSLGVLDFFGAAPAPNGFFRAQVVATSP